MFVKKRPDPKLEADYEIPKKLFGILGLRPRLGISKENRTFGIESVQSVWITGLKIWRTSIIQQQTRKQFHNFIVFGKYCEKKVHRTQPNKRNDFLQNDKS